MKIYSRTTLSQDSFDYYVGKDVWVLVAYKYDSRYLRNRFWIKILYYDNDKKFYVVNCVSCIKLNLEDGTYHCTAKDMEIVIDSPRNMDPTYYSLIEPIDVRTTQELFTIID